MNLNDHAKVFITLSLPYEVQEVVSIAAWRPPPVDPSRLPPVQVAPKVFRYHLKQAVSNGSTASNFTSSTPSKHRLLRSGHEAASRSVSLRAAKATQGNLGAASGALAMFAHFRSSLNLLLNFYLLVSIASAACYYPNGTDVAAFTSQNEAYQPCNVTAQASMCCRINIADESGRDHCRSDGLCASPKRQYLWRESCSDPTWKSPHCQKLCLDYDGLDPFGNSVVNNNVALTVCDDGSLCCGTKTNGSTCCIEGKGVWMVDGKETTVNPNATVSTSTSALPASTSSASTAANAAESTSSTPKSSSHKSNTGAIAGGVVGGVVGLAVIGGAIYWLFHPRQLGNGDPSQSNYNGQHTAVGSGAEKRYRPELPDTEIPYEADGMQRNELDGGSKQIWVQT
ncbi:hypothetical protein G7Y79_00073g098080 [Physcia stellaris]|nr:hypothetical protein G7Y79_00073g098080 [Physcia stellaris]